MGAESESILMNRRRTQIDNEVVIKRNFSDDEMEKLKTFDIPTDYLHQRISSERVEVLDNGNENGNGNGNENFITNQILSSQSVSTSPSFTFNTNLLPSEIGTDLNFKRKIVWKNAIGFLILHIAAVTGVFQMLLAYSDIRTTVYSALLVIASGMGITMGAHRLFTHRAFKAKTWLRVALIILHTMAGQNCLYVWVRDHRQHHKYSDTDADPHNATRGFFFSHIGWLMSKKHPMVIEFGKKIDMSDLEADPWIMFQKKYYKTLYLIFTIVIPTAVPVLLWNENLVIAIFTSYFARTVVQLNFTWSVNSVAHIFGSKPYDKTMLPVESKFVAFVAAGEGWHNYHHTFPWDYRAAELGMAFNLTTRIIDYFARRGDVFDRKFVSDEMIRNRVLRTGDGTHEKFGSMPEEITESELILRKYIVEKQQVSQLMNHLENYCKDDDLNNNMDKTKTVTKSSLDSCNNEIVHKLKDKKALNVC